MPQPIFKEKYMDAKTPENTLWIYSQIFLAFAIINIVKMVVNLLDGSLNVEMLASVTGASSSLVQVVVTCIIVLMAIVVLMELFMGVRGMQQAQGKGHGHGHIVVAKIAAAFILLSAVTETYDIFSNLSQANFGSWASLIVTLASLAMVVFYHNAAKAIGD